MERIELVILYKDGNEEKIRAIANKWTFSDTMMGEQAVMCNIVSEKPIPFAVGDYCVFRGETYTLNYVPSVTQKAKTGEIQDAYTYENVKFDSYQDELSRCMLLDVTPTTEDYIAAYGTNYTGSSKFTLYCGESTINGRTLTAVCALAAKIQANLDRMYSRGTWSVLVDTETTYVSPSGGEVLMTHTDDKMLSFDNSTVIQALAEVHNAFDLNYCIRGRVIYIGFQMPDLTENEGLGQEGDDEDEDVNSFTFGYGKGYPRHGNDGKGLFKIKRIANSQQRIVTRLRAMGSTKNMPYRYYNKKYGGDSNPELTQSLFPTNLQLPGTFLPEGNPTDTASATGATKWSRNNARSEFLRKVKGDTNDAYIDKNDNAANCEEGIREGNARWDGSNSDLQEIYPTIEGVKYIELREALVQDMDGKAGGNGESSASAFYPYQNQERIDKLLAVGYMDNGSMVDDANVGDGILPESGSLATGIPRPSEIELTTILFNQSGYGDFNYGNDGVYRGIERRLFSVQGVTPGNYAIAPTIGSVVYSFNILAGYGVSAEIGFIITVRQTNLQSGVVTTIAEYNSDFVAMTYNSGIGEVEIPYIPDVENTENAKVNEIAVTAQSDITVSFTPVMRNVILQGGANSFYLEYKVGNSRVDSTVSYEPECMWIPLDDGGSIAETFHVFIQDMGFDLSATFTGDTPVVSMKSGRCVGREFEIGENIQKVAYNGKKGYMLTLKRATDSSLNTYYPSQVSPLSAGDYFVLLNIEMPDAYILAAEARLLMAATDYLSDNSQTVFTYQPYIDDIYLQRNYDNMVKQGKREKSIFWQLYAGLKFSFNGIPSSSDSPLPFAKITIEKVMITMGDGLTPKVDIVLNDDIQQTTLQKLTIAVDRIYGGSMFNTGLGSLEMIDNALLKVLQTYGSNYFLSKTKADTAQGIITFAKGVFFGPDSLNVWGYVRSVIENGVTKAKAWFQNLYANYLESINAVITGNLKGGANGLLIQDDVKVEKANGQDAQLQVATLKSTNIENSDTVKTHNLIVTGLAHFFELIIDKIRASGGAEIKSAAEGFKVEAIWECELSLPYDPDNQLGETIDARRLYFLAKDPEGRQRIQSWKRLDQAICMTFNASAGTSYNVSNKYFWALVGGVSETPVEIEIDGETVECHYIDIYTGDGTETSAQIPVDENGIKLWDGLPSAVAVGDEIAMLGYRGTDEPARQSAIYESAYSALDLELTAPLHAVYMGINDFNLSSHRKSFSDATRNTFIGEFYSNYIANGGKDLAHELNDITSRAIIKGGSGKQRLRLLYSELKAKYLRLAIDMNASAWYSNTDTYKDSGTIPCYNFAPTYQNINTAIDDIWLSLHGLLNSYVDEFDELQTHDDTNEEYPFWLNDDNVNADTDLNAMEDPYKQKKDITDDDFSLSTFYEETWRNVYEVFQEAEYAIDVFTRKIVDEAAVDGVLSGKEKSMLRTAFANEVNRYFEIKSELASFGKTIYKRDNSTPVTTDDVRDAINDLGTYLNAGQAWKVEPTSGDAANTDYWHEGNDYVYPSMLTSASTTASTTIEASTYQTKWNDWFSARDEIVSDMAYARQKIVNDVVTDTVPPFYYVGATNPLEDPQTSSRVKDGDHWYKPVTLTNPTNGQTISNIDGKPIYDHYVCKTIEGRLDWVLLTAATQAVMSVADAIYLSVFDSSNSSSIVQLVNKITEKVSGTGITGANLILNSDFDTMADGNPEHFTKEGNVDWERTTEQMPTGFNHSLLITAGAGEGIRMQNPSQPKLRLDNEQNYILSAFVRIASANNVTPILQVRRGVNASTNVLQEFELEGDLWQRISLNITGDNIAEPIKFTLKTAGSFYITGIQLEKGSILTAWRKAEEDWQGSIDLLKDRINLSVTKDGLRQAGMEISGDDKSVTLFGKQVKVDGDLDLTGLTTENVTKIPYDITRPVVVNMGIFEDETDADNVTVKSVQFEARNVALDGTNTGIPRLVCLPFYDSAIEGNDKDWKAQTNIAFSADNTFSIFTDNSVPDSLKRIIQYKKTGTRITITNEADQFAKNWQRLMDSANANNAQQDVSKLRGNAIVVCSDARLLAEENYDGEDGVYEFEKRLLPNDGYGVVPKWNGGLFSCGGYLARFIAVLPGQTLQLRSQIMKIDVYQEVLVWVVENPMEFVPMINPLIIDTGEMVYLYGDSHDNTNPLPTVNFTSSYNGILDTWMGHEVLNKIEQSPFEIALVR